MAQKKQDQSVSFLTKAKDFLKGIPAAVVRVFGGSTAEAGLRTAGTIGSKAAELVNAKLGRPLIPTSPETQKFASGIQEGLNKPALGGVIRSLGPLPSPVQTAGLYAEAAIDTVTALSGGKLLSLGAKGIISAESKALVKKAILKNVVEDFITGAATGTAVEFQQPEDQRNVIGGALTAGVANVVLPRFLGAATSFAIDAASKVSKFTRGFADNIVAPELKRIATREARQKAELRLSKNFPFDAEPVAPATVLEKGAGIALKAIEATRDSKTKLAQAFETVFAPARRIGEQMKEKGVGPEDLENKFQMTRLFGTEAKKMSNQYVQMGPMAYGPEAWALVKKKARFLDELDRQANSQGTLPHDVVQLKKSYEEWWSKMSDDTKMLVDSGLLKLRNFTDDLLDRARKVGRISEEDYTRIKQAHPNYIPHKVVFDEIDWHDPNPLPSNTKSFGPGQLEMKGAQGSMRDIADIDEAMVGKIITESFQNKKQEALNALFNSVRGSEEEFGFKQLTDREDLLKRQEIIHQRSLLGVLKDKIDSILSSKESAAKLLLSEINKLNKQGLKAALKRDYFEEGGTKSVRNNIAAMLSMPKSEYLKERAMIAVREAKLEPLLKDIDALRNTYESLSSSRKDLWEQAKVLAGEQMKAKDVPPGMEKFTFINQGVHEDWLVPKDVGMMLKAIDPTGMSAVSRLLNSTLFGKTITLPAKVLRAAQVALNPLFMFFRNPVRDIQQAWMSIGAFGESWMGALRDVIKDKNVDTDSIYKQASEAGAFVGGLLRETQDPKAVLDTILSENGIGSKKIIPKAGSYIKEIWTGAGEMFEQATRLMVFKKGLKDGMNPEQAAKFARDATVDFSKAGYVTEVLNKVIPFLNPAVQGTINIGKLIAKDPVTFYRRAFNQVVMPTMILHAFNSRSEGYYNISEGTRLRNWVIVLGDTTGRDPRTGAPGKKAFYVAIPKNEIATIVSGLVDYELDHQKNKNQQAYGDFVQNLVGNISPVNFDSVSPTGFKTLQELKQNRDFYRQRDIVPEWVQDKYGKWVKSAEVPPEFRYNERYTNEVSEMLGKLLKVSPAQVEFVAQQYGGVFNQMLWALDLPLQRLTQDGKYEAYSKLIQDKKSVRFDNAPIIGSFDTTWADKLANSPFLRSIISVSQPQDTGAVKRAQEEKQQILNRPRFESKK